MIILNKKTRRDVTVDYLKLLEGKITREEFAVIAGIEDKTKYNNLK